MNGLGMLLFGRGGTARTPRGNAPSRVKRLYCGAERFFEGASLVSLFSIGYYKKVLVEDFSLESIALPDPEEGWGALGKWWKLKPEKQGVVLEPYWVWKKCIGWGKGRLPFS